MACHFYLDLLIISITLWPASKDRSVVRGRLAAFGADAHFTFDTFMRITSN